MDSACDDNGDATIDALVQRLVGKDERMQLPDKCLAYGIAGFDEIIEIAERITVSSRLKMVLKRLLAYGHAGKHHRCFAERQRIALYCI